MADIENSKKAVVLAKDMGIGNRIMFLFSCLRIFKPQDFTLYWPAEGWVTMKFFDLFKFDWDYPVTENNEIIKERNINLPAPLCFTEGWRLYIDKNDGLPQFFQKEYLDPPHGYGIDLEYNRIPENIKDIYRPYFKRLHPSDAVAKRIEDVTLPENAVAVYMTNDTNWKELKVNNRNIEIKKYFKAMDKHPKDTVFFVSYRNPDTIKPFVDRYKDRIITLPHKDCKRMTDAVADLFIMSKCKEMILPYESTFCCLAWWIGGANAAVTIVRQKQSIGKIIRKFIKRRKIRKNVIET